MGASALLLAATITTGACGRPATGAASGADVYQRSCAKCHGVAGGGGIPSAPGEPAPRNFNDGAWQASISDEELRSTVKNGKGAMPAFADVLDENELGGLVSAIRSFDTSSN